MRPDNIKGVAFFLYIALKSPKNEIIHMTSLLLV